MANERTFAGWARTAMAAIGIGIGFNALFGPLNPTWAPKSIATVFILLGVFIIMFAERRARLLSLRLTAHQTNNFRGSSLTLVTWAITAGAIGLVGAIWCFE